MIGETIQEAIMKGITPFMMEFVKATMNPTQQPSGKFFDIRTATFNIDVFRGRTQNS